MSEEHSKDGEPLPEAMFPRFHAAHPSAAGHANELAPVAPDLLAAVAGKSQVAHDQLRQQAAELAEHLQQRQHQLVRREATLNARSAAYDDQQRSALLWLRERQSELDRRAADIQREMDKRQEQADEEQLASKTAQAVAREREQIQRDRLEVQELQAQLKTELENVQHQASWLEAARNSWRVQCNDEQRTLGQLREQLLDQRQATEELNARLREQLDQNHRDALAGDQLTLQQRQIEIQTAQLQDQQAALEEQRQSLARDRELWQARTTQQRQTIAAKWHRRRQALRRQRESLQNRHQTLHIQEDALRQRQEDLNRQRSELVQRQLVMQHAQATLSRQFAEGDFSHIEQAVRQYVESQAVAVQQKFSTRKCELQELAASLSQQQETLKIRHARLNAQIALRQRELDDQATKLDDREQALCRRECQLLD